MYGPSMLPTFAATGDVVLEDRFSVLLGRPFARGDLITFVSPANPSHIVCKRILGLPGDVVCVDPTGTVAPSDEHVVIPRGHVWVQGDNADNSRDSRYYGPLSMGLVRGFVYARVSSLRFQLSASLTRESGAVVAVQHREDIPWRAQRFISRLTADILVVITVINGA